ncbi:MAG TPA: hypothetical protein VK668_02895 [Mucilaginibacter sp.]|nr:hypothetical protein [Mucilaginibacter sp.]
MHRNNCRAACRHINYKATFVARIFFRAPGVKVPPASTSLPANLIPVTAVTEGTLSLTIFMSNAGLLNCKVKAKSFAFNSFRVGYSYQFGTSNSNLAGASNATNEFTLRYRLGNKKADWKTF